MSTVSSLITRKPLLPIITIKKNDASLYTYNPFTPTFNFRVRRLQVSPPFSNTSGTFNLQLTSSDGTNSGANTLISNIDEGNEVTIWIGKSDATKIKVFTGVIETWSIKENNKNFMYLEISGPDFGSDVLKNRIVNGKWGQELNSSGDAVDTDLTTSIHQVVTDMLTNDTYYPDRFNEVTAADQGVIVTASNIKGQDLKLKAFSANFEFIGDKLQALDEIGGTVHWVDPDKNFHMDYPTTLSGTSSGVLLTDDNLDAVALSWSPTKIGLIAPDSELTRTLENHKRRIWGMGGLNIGSDQFSTLTNGQTSLHDYNYAMKFVPDYSTIAKVKLWLGKVGTPPNDFVMEIRESFSGLPTGRVLRTVSKPKAFLNGASQVFPAPVTFEINEDVIIGHTYWIVVRKIGDVSNTFTWYHNNTDASPVFSARSATDGSPTPDWALTTTPNRFKYAFIQYKGDAINSVHLQNPITSSTKHLHDDVIRKDDITDAEVMHKLLVSETDTLFKRKEIFKASIYAPDTLLTAGQKVRIRKQASGYTFDADFVLGKIDYIFESSDDQSTGSFYYFIEAVRFVDIS